MDFSEKPELISKYASLKLTELILSNGSNLNTQTSSIDEEELNLFKAFLSINSQLNNIQELGNLNENNFERLIDLSLLFKFPESDLGFYENDDSEFVKVLFSAIHKVEELFKFLNSSGDYVELKNQYLESFSTKSEEDFISKMKCLFGQLLVTKRAKNYIF